ncbi:MAG: 16S rRNA (adenine(1518)-N(6)/adenine(1519)-N(6))-dimethyltransferase RsmA [Alphaproteobacteria bacterium]|nr:16S rRNA (adenine(1518)-N(6)/adenine(1519)-N(6))-dimethyltransferase RsmA [Alphaproteobacteria bacterium]
MTTLADLPPLREALAAHGLMARKSFGQHFLLDLNITRKIARLAALAQGDTVIEVGPGPGGLTRALIETGAHVVAIEKDERFRPLLEDLAAAAAGALTIVMGDALLADEAALAGGEAHVVSNLPYNVGTPLLVKWLTGAWTPASLTLMFQKEVADRIVAPPGGGAYGRLAVIAQATCEARAVMDVPARAFTPPPKVDSAVVRLTPRPGRPAPDRLDALQRVTAAAFGQRRKMLRASLKALGGEALARAAGLDPQARAETVDIPGFLRLADAWLQLRNRPA